MKKARRFLSLMLVILLFAGMLPLGGVSLTPVAEAAGTTTPAGVTEEVALARVNYLADRLNGKFFTTTGKTCHSPAEKSHGCSKCGMWNATGSDWFKKLIDLTPSNKVSLVHYTPGGSVKNGQSCRGFANFAGWYVYAQRSTDQVEFTKLKVGRNTKAFMAEAKPGDIIASSSHSRVFICNTESGYKYIDCNSHWSGGNSKIAVDTKNYDTEKVAISRAKNFISCQHTNLDANGDCQDCHNYHEHRYDENGICKKATCKDNYYGHTGIFENANGTATAKSGSSFYVYKEPYMASGRVQTKVLLGLVNKDLSVNKATVTAKVTNHVGNMWYKLKVNSVSYPVYVNENTVDVQWKSIITFKDVTAPKDQAVEGNGAKTTVKGTVSAQNAKISEVTAAVYDVRDISSDLVSLQSNKYSAAQAYQLAQSKAKYYEHDSGINSETFTLSKKYDSALKFRYLAGGQKYIYVVTATDTNGTNACSPHSFYLRTSSGAKTTYSVMLITNGSTDPHTVEQGSSVTLPERTRAGQRFLGWADSEEAYNTLYPAGTALTPAGDTELYAVFGELEPPAVPVLTEASYDIAEGATQTVSWNAVETATSYIAYVYDTEGTRVYEQPTAGTFVILPFQNEGEYSVRVEAFNGSLAGGSGESTHSVTVRVHGPSTVTFLNYDGSVYATQAVSYGGNADTPTSPSRAGYTFSRWEGNMNQIREDTTLTAVYTPISYAVTFYNPDGSELTTEYVTYNGDMPGSAVAPTAPQKDYYTFVGWSRDFDSVTESGIKVYPVYVWANEDVPLSINITNVTSAGDGYWVYYTVTNHVSRPQIGRVVIAGKTSLGKFITQTESGAFYLAGGDGTSYQGNAYVPVDSADMLTLATVEAYVVDNYTSKNPIAEPDTYHIGSVDGEYTAWMTAEELAAFTGSYSGTETATQYSTRTKTTYSTTATYYLGWPVESTTTTEGSWGNWSGWQDAYVAANDRRQVETRSVLVSDAHTEYRYGRWYASTATGNPSGNIYTPAISPSFAHANYNYYNASSVFSKDYSAWSTTRTNPYGSDWIRTSHHDSEQTWYKVDGNMYYWHYYYPTGTVNKANRYFWEETRTVAAQYKTQYRYRDKSADITTYTYYNWSDWSDYTFTAATPTSNKEVQTRTVYRAKLTSGVHGSTYTFSGQVGPAAAGKQALLNVYKVDAASDYSNQYIEQITLGANGSYSFSFDTLEIPSPQTGDYTVSLTIEGGTESLYIGTIEAPKAQYTVLFMDEVTGLSLGNQIVSEGSAATAPEVPEHEGYYFLGWEYGLGNIRENMIIKARYVKRGYTVVFVDHVQMTVSMENDVPYETAVMAPEVTAPEGYIFIGWEVPEGMSLDSVTGHMIVTAKYEHITNTVSFLNVDEEVIAQQTVNYGEYAYDPLAPEEYEFGEDEDYAANIAEEDLAIPESMYFIGWSEGAEDPVTQTLTLTPMLAFLEDVEEVTSTLEGGIYAGGQTTTLTTEGSTEDLNVQYRITTADGEDGDWIDYDMDTAPEIAINETCILEIEANAENENTFTASYEYVIVSESDVLSAPANVAAEQNDTESVGVQWSTVPGASGYKVVRVSDCDELAEFDVENTTSFVDYGVDELRKYSYQVCAYSMLERGGASLMLDGNASEQDDVFFYGDFTPISTVTVSAPATVLEGSATQLSAAVAPVDAYDTSVCWICTDGTGEGWVSDDGLFYGVSAGTVNVTAKAMDGSEQSDTVTINVQEIAIGEDYATMTVSSGQARAGGTANISVSITEDSLAEMVQFAVLYDSSKLTLTAFTEGAAMQGLSPTISNPQEGVVLFVWDDVTSLTAGGSLLDLTFTVKPGASGTAIVEIPTNSDQYDFVFARGDDAAAITVNSINGALDIVALLLGDVNGDEKVNVIDANMIRRKAALLLELDEMQMLAADVNGDGKVNVIDANLIRRYAAHLIDVFPAEANSAAP